MTPYIDFYKEKHLKQGKVNYMINLSNELQSANRFNSLQTSRRDDLEMLCNLLIYITNKYRFPDMQLPRSTNKNNEHKLYYM